MVRTCLAKDPENRFHSAHDLLVQLKWVRDVGSQASPAMPVAGSRPRGLGLIGTALLALLLASASGIAVWLLKPEPPQPVRRFTIVLPEGDQFSATARHFVAVSPDGMQLAYVSNQRLYIRKFDQLDATPIRGTEEGGQNGHGRNPFFSPDSQWIGFWQGGQLKKVSVNGGAPVVLCAAENPLGASWGADGTILFGQGAQGISQVSATGGEATVIAPVDLKTETARGPQMLPGGKAVLFTLASSATQRVSQASAAFWDNAQIVVQSVDSGERKTVVQGGTDARYLPTGHLAYVRDGTLFAVPFDVSRLETTGSAFPIADGIRQSNDAALGGVAAGGGTPGTGAAQFSVSDDGLFAYVPRDTAAVGGVRTLVWVDRQGRETPLAVPDRVYVYPRISPDGNRIALDIRDQEQDIWVWSLAAETLTRLTFDPAADIGPVWSADGRRIAFIRAGAGIFWQAADGTGETEQLFESGYNPVVSAFSRDGMRLIFAEGTSPQTMDLKTLALEGRAVSDLLAQPMVLNRNADISPDGRWLAYQSDESGRFEIYVRPFPDVQGGRWQVSRAGGTRPLWARNGRGLCYLVPGGQQSATGNTLVGSTVTIMVLPVEAGPYFSGGKPNHAVHRPVLRRVGRPDI